MVPAWPGDSGYWVSVLLQQPCDRSHYDLHNLRLQGAKSFLSIVVVIVGHPLKVWVEAIDGVMCRRLAVGRQTTSCIGTRNGRVGTIHTVGIRTHFGITNGWVAIQGSIDCLKVVNRFFFDGGLHLLFWNC